MVTGKIHIKIHFLFSHWPSTLIGNVHTSMGSWHDPDPSCLQGDSGGPLQCEVDGEWHLVGVASRTGPPDCENYPSVYIRVSKYLDWIAENMQ